MAHKIALFLIIFIKSTLVMADDWWLLSYKELKCVEPVIVAGKRYTPTVMTQEFPGCFSESFDEGKGVYLNCDASSLKTNFIFTKSMSDCEKWAKKLKPLHGKGAGFKKTDK